MPKHFGPMVISFEDGIIDPFSITLMESSKRSIEVVAAIIVQDDKIFLAQRGYGELKGKWEFPGGKVEEGETREEALEREIEEELSTSIEVEGFFTHIDYDYPSFLLDMDVYFCRVLEGRLIASKGIHSDEGFFRKEELSSIDFCPADRIVADRLAKSFK